MTIGFALALRRSVSSAVNGLHTCLPESHA
jgi:hypothetical protein